MTVTKGIGMRSTLVRTLTAMTMVMAYLLGTVAVTTAAMTSSSTSAEARGRRGRRGGRGRGRGRRGRRGRGCSIVLWDLGLC